MHTGGKSATENEVFKTMKLDVTSSAVTTEFLPETSHSLSLNSLLTVPTNVIMTGRSLSYKNELFG